MVKLQPNNCWCWVNQSSAEGFLLRSIEDVTKLNLYCHNYKQLAIASCVLIYANLTSENCKCVLKNKPLPSAGLGRLCQFKVLKQVISEAQVMIILLYILLSSAVCILSPAVCVSLCAIFLSHDKRLSRKFSCGLPPTFQIATCFVSSSYKTS